MFKGDLMATTIGECEDNKNIISSAIDVITDKLVPSSIIHPSPPLFPLIPQPT